MTAKLPVADRKKQILDAAVKQAAVVGYQNIKRQDIADEIGISTGLINLHFSTMTQLKRDVMRAAVRNKVLPIVAQGIVAKDKQALKASEELKKAALKSLAAA